MYGQPPLVETEILTSSDGRTVVEEIDNGEPRRITLEVDGF